MRTEAEEEIRARIVDKGRITFAEFMNVALYHPVGGYYSDAAALSDHRDFYTSPAAHPAFGALVAVQLARMWELLDRPAPFYGVEVGAGSGALARDVVDYATEALGPFSEALHYVAVDRAQPSGPSSLFSSVTSDTVPLKSIVGCLLSNELFDSFPVHRFEVREGRVMEVFVALQNGRLLETLAEPSTPLLEEQVRRWGLTLNEGYCGEVNPRIGPWMEEAARALRKGFVLTLDYGYDAGDLRSRDWTRGTLQTFYRHTDGGSQYRRVGAQDMTAHVDFTTMASEGERVGLQPLLLTTQASWLSAMGMGVMIADLRGKSLNQLIRDANLMAMRQLVDPDGLGGFKVLIQEKDADVTGPEQLLPVLGKLAAPVLRPEHAALMAAKYPHLAFEPPFFRAVEGP